MSTTKIPTTVGRVVLYRCEHNGEEHAATIAKVNDDGTINIGALDGFGVPYSRVNVPLVQEGDPTPESGCGFAYWMQYQKDVAAGRIPPVHHADPKPTADAGPESTDEAVDGGGQESQQEQVA